MVSAQPVMQRSAGQFTYLPNDLRSKTDNSFELLRLVPLLDVSDRGISIFGKDASRIFINGRVRVCIVVVSKCFEECITGIVGKACRCVELSF